MSTDKNYLVNFSEKLIIDPRDLTLSGNSSFLDLARVEEVFGNPFQYELFNLLKDEWQGHRIAICSDDYETMDLLLNERGFEIDRRFEGKYRRLDIELAVPTSLNIHPDEYQRISSDWESFINEYLLINYDRGYFMTLDRRLLRLNENIMPYFHFAQVKNAYEQDNTWVGQCIGIEAIDSSTIESRYFIEMYRMIGDMTLCELIGNGAEQTYTEVWV